MYSETHTFIINQNYIDNIIKRANIFDTTIPSLESAEKCTYIKDGDLFLNLLDKECSDIKSTPKLGKYFTENYITKAKSDITYLEADIKKEYIQIERMLQTEQQGIFKISPNFHFGLQDLLTGEEELKY